MRGAQSFIKPLQSLRRVHIGFRKMANVADHYDGRRKWRAGYPEHWQRAG